VTKGKKTPDLNDGIVSDGKGHLISWNCFGPFRTAKCTAFEARFGKEMHSEYGWAAKALKNPRPNFAQIEKAVSLDHWRPRYRWASQHTHGGFRPALSMLDTAESPQPVHLVGQSNSGFTDPLHMTAISLNNSTSSPLIIRPTVDNVIFLQIIADLSNDIGEASLSVEKGRKVEAPKPEPNE
jgi:hypothetical protein